MNWLKAVHDADSEHALLAIVNEYLLAYPEAYWSWIPREARPRLVASAADLHDWQRRLFEHLGTVASPNIRLQDLAVFFIQASARAIELEGSKSSCNQDDCDSREAG
jgi:hypothetical protein